MATAVSLIAIGVAITQFQTWNREVELIRTGLQLKARLLGVPGTSRQGNKISFPGQVVEFELWSNGKPTSRPNNGTWVVTTRLPEADHPWQNTTLYPIIVNPTNYEEFTLFTKPRPLAMELMGALILTPLIAALMLLCLWRRQRLLRIWADGDVHEAVVIDSMRAGSAPDSKLVRCTLKAGRDQRILRVLVPRSVTTVNPGDTLWLLTPPRKIEPALAAAALPR